MFCAYHMHFFLTLLFLSLIDILLIFIGAMKDKVDILKKGILVLLPEPDDRGRAIIYTNLSLLGEGDTAEKVFFLLHCVLVTVNFLKTSYLSCPSVSVSKILQMIQLWWYLIHCAMERPSCRKVSGTSQ